jgi:SAM-dependent methyltransferase
VTAATPSGRYPLEPRAAEIERLVVQGEAMAGDCAVMLDRIGVVAGWRCLDLGCGPGGITTLMGERVGAGGHVVGLDGNAAFLEFARRRAPSNVEFVLGDAYRSGLPAHTFDLVHMRYVGSTAGRPQALIDEAMRLARPGRFVAMQEPDMATLVCHPPHPAWERLRAALVAAFASADADINLGRRLFALARGAGLSDVQYRPFLVGVRCGDPLADYLPSTAESLRGTILGRQLMTEAEFAAAVSECRAHLRKPDTVFTSFMTVQVWGRTG